MSGLIDEASAKLVNSIVLQAMSRLVGPILIPIVLWAGAELWNLEKRQTATETRLASIEDATRTGTSNDREQATGVAVLAEGQRHMLRVLDQVATQMLRIEQRLDSHMAAHQAGVTAPNVQARQ